MQRALAAALGAAPIALPAANAVAAANVRRDGSHNEEDRHHPQVHRPGDRS